MDEAAPKQSLIQPVIGKAVKGKSVLIIGCGKAGGAIAENIMKKPSVSQILLNSRTVDSIKALKKNLHSSKAIMQPYFDETIKPDYIIITLSIVPEAYRKDVMEKSTNTLDVRLAELDLNLAPITKLVDQISKFQKSRIIVVTNPVDEIVNYLRIKLKKDDIIGFGLDLDAMRYRKELIAKGFERFIANGVQCIGRHGRAVPILGEDQPESFYEQLYNEHDGKLLEYIRKNGIPYSDCGIAFGEFFDILNGSGALHGSYATQNMFGFDFAFSMPLKTNDGMLSAAEVKLSYTEQLLVQKMVKDLKHKVEMMNRAAEPTV